MKRDTTQDSATRSPINWVWISGIGFMLSLLASAMLIFFGERLNNLGITGNIYYIVLIPLGLGCAAFLAGAMKSYASFKSNGALPYGRLNLSGPIVIFILVVGGGFIMPNLNKKSEFTLKLRLVSKDRATSEFNDGAVIAYLGDEKIQANIRDGIAEIPNVPEIFNNRNIKVDLIKIPDYELVKPSGILISKNMGYVDLPVYKKEVTTLVRGSLINRHGQPVKNALLDFESGLATCHTDANGNFSLVLPLQDGHSSRLKIYVDGVLQKNEAVTISSSIPIDQKLD